MKEVGIQGGEALWETSHHLHPFASVVPHQYERCKNN